MKRRSFLSRLFWSRATPIVLGLGAAPSTLIMHDKVSFLYQASRGTIRRIGFSTGCTCGDVDVRLEGKV